MNTPPVSTNPCPPDPSDDPPGRVARVSPFVFVAFAAVALIVHMVLFIRRYAVNVFFSDQWDYLDAFFHHDPGIAELFFWQHGPHREGVGLLLDKFLYPLTAWDTRVDSFLICACLASAALLAVVLKKHLFGALDYWDAIIPALFLTLTQWEELTVTPNPAHGAFPLLLIMLYLLALRVRKEWIKYGALLAINFLLIYTGFGIFMGPITIGFFALVCIQRLRGFTSTPLVIAAGGLTVACVSFASFFYRYRFDPAVDCFAFPVHPLSVYPEFVAILFSSYLGFHSAAFFSALVGAPVVIFALMILFTQLKRIAQGDNLIALTLVILLTYSLLFAVNTALGRACLGLPAAAQSARYPTLLIPAFLAMYLYLRDAARNRTLRFGLVALAIALIPGHIHVARQIPAYTDHKRAWVDCYRQMDDIGACKAATHFELIPHPEWTQLKEKLDYLKSRKLNLFAE